MAINASSYDEVDDSFAKSEEDQVVVVPVKRDKWTSHHAIVFILTFLTYALFHASRKTFSNVKSSISAEWLPQNLTESDCFPYQQWNSHRMFETDGEAETFLGYLDASFLFAYSVGLFLSGYLGDRFDPRYVLTIGMWLSALTLLGFGYLTEVFHFYNKGFYIAIWLLAGFVQSCGWPNVVCVMGNWFGKGSRGVVLGLWSSCQSIGNIIGSYLAAYFLSFGYEYTFLVSASLMFFGGIVVFFTLVSAPRQIGLPDPKESTDDDTVPVEYTQVRPQAIGFFRAFLLPGVIAYSLGYACLKLVNYSFFFWLPYYLHNKFLIPEAESDQLSTWYDWGGIVGGFIAGFITDLLGCRAPLLLVTMICAVGSLVGYIYASSQHVVQAVSMAVVGYFIGGASNVIAGAVSADLGRNPDVQGSAEAIATVTGILDGTGSLGSAAGQLLVPFLDKKYNWNSVFIMFIVMSFLTIVCLSKLAFVESVDLFHRIRNRVRGIRSDTAMPYDRISEDSRDLD